ncbi:hypothetical protein [Dysgonomonas macrotermitis]|uniref:Uncharacterized protein n=1 Tax=Dysgonomonas macrotermitis TaxID=1346286 RepID=A0A1M4SBH0_9BACT|nr:hypothetical protein [Dysgonomonas macrotermitis]SHE29540.1 hypothetical protein SAMN05444362_10111 [Dysgonomonas macrotermitis]
MKFKYSAFIENTPKAREWLEKIGYYKISENIILRDNLIISTYPNGWYNLCYSHESSLAIDCQNNLPLFKAITAITDIRNMHQLFVADTDIYHGWSDTIGEPYDYIIPKGILFDWDLSIEYADILKGEYHKATITELKEHFKLKP